MLIHKKIEYSVEEKELKPNTICPLIASLILPSLKNMKQG